MPSVLSRPAQWDVLAPGQNPDGSYNLTNLTDEQIDRFKLHHVMIHFIRVPCVDSPASQQAFAMNEVTQAFAHAGIRLFLRDLLALSYDNISSLNISMVHKTRLHAVKQYCSTHDCPYS